MALGMKVSEIRSGGQSGIDESGIKAALAYGIPAGITFPRGWLYNDAQGHPHWNKVAFMQRFDGIERIQIPRIEFDVAQALHQDEPEPEVKSYNPGRDSVMLGVIAGDIIASPYFHAEPESPRFELFAPTRRGYGQNAVNIHPSPTNNSSLSLVVGQWLSSDQDHSETVLRRMVSALNLDHYTSNNIAAAASVTGLYASKYRGKRSFQDCGPCYGKGSGEGEGSRGRRPGSIHGFPWTKQERDSLCHGPGLRL